MSLKKLGRYELVRVLGKGAMGIVYEGKDPNLDRRVAIKTVKVENLSEEAAAEYEHRFRTEARSAARLQHPNIVSVYDSDRDGDIAFLVMEYIQGDDLKHHLDKGVRYSLEQSLKMVRDLLSALDYAHKQGIVHRDIKPANLLIEPGGRVKLTDFGVARIQDSGEATRTQGSMVGTLKYMAPEQVQGQKIDSRADLFSVGVVLYQLLTDKRPFDGDNDFSIIHQIIGHTPPHPSTINPKLPTAIDAVVARALAKTREERFATARDFAAAMQSAIRRAEDVTVVPAANPLKKPDAGGTGSRGLQSVVGAVTSPSTVTQEVELVYWKDIKDSTDAEEFEAFLEKFPAGIYADLARRRLRKLTGGANTSPDQTVLSGSALTATPQRADEPDEEATRLRTGTMPSMVKPVEATSPAAVPAPPPVAAPVPAVASAPAVAPAAAEAAPVASLVTAEGGSSPTGTGTGTGTDGTDFPETITFIRPDAQKAVAKAGAAPATPVSSPAPAAAASAATAKAAPAERAAKAPAAAGTARKPPVAVLAGIGAVAVIGIAAFALMGRSHAPADSAAAAASSAASAAAAPAEVASAASSSAQVPATGVTPAVAASEPVQTASAAASAAPAAASKTAVATASKPAPAKVAPAKPKASGGPAQVETARPAFVPQPHTETARPAPAPAPAAANGSAVEACREKMFLTREFCLAEQCEKPAARNHPLCVKWREEKRLREGTGRGAVGGGY
ncbi:serine/threonine-protein kinase [Ramlibacter sp. PS4R-6]|uniref:serine/threonine-protein kinase n=1 Tax=Ramlibacter sp. PS4R-6 TaxID=3133438 RepID=UPI003096AD57